MGWIKKILGEWLKDNLFRFRVWDAGAYFFLYLLIPVIISYVSLKTAREQPEIIYSYLSILISALNCIYDAANRWNTESKSIINLKLLVMIIVLAVISAYCIYMIIAKLLNLSGGIFFDEIFYVYYIIAAIAIVDIMVCLGRGVALKAYIKEHNRG